MFNAAITDLHAANGHTGEYQEYCADCGLLPVGMRSEGCNYHQGDAHLFRKGDPCGTRAYKNTKKKLVKDAKLEGYKERGSMQLLPVDLRSLRTHLLSVPCLPNIRTWCTIIFATMLFLRYDEFHEVKGEHFLPVELFSIYWVSCRLLSIWQYTYLVKLTSSGCLCAYTQIRNSQTCVLCKFY